MNRAFILIALTTLTCTVFAEGRYYSYWNYCEGYMYNFNFATGIHKAYQYYKIDGKDTYIVNNIQLKKESDGVYLTGVKNQPRIFFDTEGNPVKLELVGQSLKFVQFDLCSDKQVRKMLNGIKSNN